MSFATARGQVKVADSLSEVVTHLVLAHNALRSDKNAHLRARCSQPRPRTYFIIGSSRPMNARTVHISPSMAGSGRAERLHGRCNMRFMRGGEAIAERDYAVTELTGAVEDILAFMDIGTVKPPISITQRKGVT